MRAQVRGHADDAGVQGRCRGGHVRRSVPRARQRELLVRYPPPPSRQPPPPRPDPRRPDPTPAATWSSPPAHIADFALPRCSWFALGIGRMCEGDGECGTEEISNCPGRDAPDASPLEAAAPVGALRNSDVYRLVPCTTQPAPDQRPGRVIIAPPPPPKPVRHIEADDDEGWDGRAVPIVIGGVRRDAAAGAEGLPATCNPLAATWHR